MKEKLPNQLTMARIFMIPIFVILFYLPEGAHFNGFVSQDHSSVMWVIAAIVFAVASFTDCLMDTSPVNGTLSAILANLRTLWPIKCSIWLPLLFL